MQGVTLEEVNNSYEDVYVVKESDQQHDVLTRHARFKQFAAKALSKCAFADTAMAIQLPLTPLEEKNSLEPLQRFVATATEMGQLGPNAPHVMGCYLPQLEILNEDDSESNPIGITRDKHYTFLEGDGPVKDRALDIWNQQGGDLMAVMMGMRIVRYSFMEDRADRTPGNDAHTQLKELVLMPLRNIQMQHSDLAANTRAAMLTGRQIEAQAETEMAEMEKMHGKQQSVPKGAVLSRFLREHVFVKIDSLRASSAFQYGCVQARCALIGQNMLDHNDTLLEFTLKQALQDPNMRWFRRYKMEESTPLKQNFERYQHGISDEDFNQKTDPNTGKAPGSILDPPWISRGGILGGWNPEGVCAVFVPYAAHSVTAATITGATLAPGSLITSRQRQDGAVEKKTLRTPVAVFFVNARGRVLNRNDLQAGGVMLPERPYEHASHGDPLQDNVFLFTSGCDIMLSMALSTRFDGTIFMTP